MARSRHWTSIAVAVLMSATIPALAGPVGPAGAQAEPDPRPNIVLINADDMTLAEMAVMDSVNELITARGTTFANMFSVFPLCCPAQASIQTGQYNHNNGVLGNGGDQWPVGGYQALDVDNTLSVWLSAAGYQTAFVGKPMVGYNQLDPLVVPPGWTEWHAVVGGDYSKSTMFQDGLKTSYSQYQTDLWTDISQDVIRRRVAEDAPLFLWTSFKGPHNAGPMEPDDPPAPRDGTPARADRHKGLFADEPLPMDPSFDEFDVSDKPSGVTGRPPLDQEKIDYLTVLNRQRLEALQAVDEGVADIIGTLAETGELDNTLIVFISDNGFMLGQHRFVGGKGVAYEPSIRVPLVMRGPGVPVGATRTHLVGMIDLAPTFVEVAQATAGLTMDGVSLFARPTSRTLVLEAGPREIDGPYYWTGLRNQRYKYVEWGTGEVELYDLRNDPYELVSLHTDPRFTRILTQAEAALERLHDCAGAECRTNAVLVG